jgi:tRNA-binding protein
MATIEDFEQLDFRIGTIVAARNFPKAKKPAYQLEIDFGGLGLRQSSAQITDRYRLEDLIGKQVLAIVNFPVRRIAGFESQVLVCGVADTDESVVLVTPDFAVPNGNRLY